MVVRVGLIGAGKMGIAHLAVVNAHPDTRVVAVCDTASYLLSALKKHTGIETYKDHQEMFHGASLDAVIIATPTATHFTCARHALDKNLHVFVEKPLTLSAAESRVLSDLAIERRRVNQVGYHNRFVGTFREARRLIRAGALGAISHVDVRAACAVVTKEQGTSWRSRRAEGGGCLHDFTCHAIDLANALVGPASRVSSARLHHVFSRDTDDAVYAMLECPGGVSATIETTWSDESARKPRFQLTVSGSRGKLTADPGELSLYLRHGSSFESYRDGWTTRDITELQPPVAYYLRGEEYTAQLDAFVTAVKSGDLTHENSFASAVETDRLIGLIDQAHQSQAPGRS